MQQILAIALLTVKAAFRFRLFPVLAVGLTLGVLVLPAVIKDDGTARGLTQIVVTYTLGLITAVLGLCTLWVACGTLARDVEECVMQTVAVKPVARWQIWLGKWLGIMMLDAMLLAFTASVVYAQMVWRAQRLPIAQQEVIRNEVFVARGSFKEPVPDFEPDVERIMQERLRKSPALAAMPKDFVRKEVQKEVKGSLERVPPGYMRQWTIDLGRTAASLRDQPLFLRVKFFAVDASPSGTYLGLWEAGPEQSPNRWQNIRSQAAETFHEFPIASNLFDSKGMLSVRFINQNETTLMFPLEDGFEVLYRAGGFGANYTRGIAIVFCWLGLLAAVGLAAASFLSFPVAAFFSVAVLILAFSTNTMVQVIEQGTIRAVDNETGQVAEANLFDHATVGFFKGMLATVKLVRDFSPIDSLSTGRKISWGQLSRAFGQVILLAGGLFMAIGIATFTRRELATAQGKT